MSPRLQRLGYWPFISFVFNLCFWRRKFHCGWSTSHGLCQAASLSAMLVLQQAHRAFKNIQVAAENLWEGSGGSSKPVICTDPFVNALTWSYPHGSFLSPCGSTVSRPAAARPVAARIDCTLLRPFSSEVRALHFDGCCSTGASGGRSPAAALRRRLASLGSGASFRPAVGRCLSWRFASTGGGAHGVASPGSL